MNSNCVKRLKKELASLTDKSNQDDSIQLTPSQESIMQWSAIITAADDSVYFGYRFKLSIEVPMEYPMIPPMIRFVTKIFHPNVLFDSGEICLDILKKGLSSIVIVLSLNDCESSRMEPSMVIAIYL